MGNWAILVAFCSFSFYGVGEWGAWDAQTTRDDVGTPRLAHNTLSELHYLVIM